MLSGEVFFVLWEVNAMEEKRRFPRVPISVQVKAKHGGLSVVSGRSYDISWGGMGLLSPEELPKGEVMDLEMDLPGSPVNARGQVAWTKEVETEEGKCFQIGIQFTEVEPEHKARLDAFFDQTRR